MSVKITDILSLAHGLTLYLPMVLYPFKASKLT